MSPPSASAVTTVPPAPQATAACPMSGAAFIAETLHAQGVSHVFFMDAILRVGLIEMERLGIRRVLGHSEKGVAYMADGFARAGRRPAVCMSQSVGAANLAAALQESWFAGSPVIALTGHHRPANQHRNTYQELDHANLFADVTKFSARIDEAEQLPHLLRQAFRAATSGPSRPVHLDLLGHLGQIVEQARIDEPVVPLPRHARIPAHRPAPDEASLEQAAAAIAAAKRPLLVAGAAAVMSGAEAEIRAFAERHHVPVAMSLDAKHVLPEFHPLNAGIVGTYSRACANRVAAAADLVIFVGSDTGDQTTNMWTLPRAEAAVVQIDIDPCELGRNYARAVGLHADPAAALAGLSRRLPAEAPGEWAAFVRQAVADWRAETEPLRRSDAIPMRPERLCKELGDWLPEDALLVADTGYSSQWTGTALHLDAPGQRYLRAAGSLGWAFPASLGAKCALPDRPVVCFTGDGGFMYHLPELETALRHGLNVVTVVNNNHRLNQGKRNIDAAYAGREGNKDEIYVYRDTDFAAVARAFGAHGKRVTDPAGLGAALDEALASGKPAVIDVVTDPDAMAPLPWSDRT